MVHDVGMINRKTDIKLVQVALKRSRVVALLGPRQCGKTTLRNSAQGLNRSTRIPLLNPAEKLRSHKRGPRRLRSQTNGMPCEKERS